MLAPMGFAEFHELCRVAGGPVVLAHAAASAGLDPERVWRRVRAEGWERPYPTVVVAPGVAVDAEVRARAAVAWIGPPAALTRWTAAHRYGVHTGSPSRVQVIVPVSRSRIAHPRLELVRSRDLGPRDIVDVDGLPCVTPHRLVRDLAAVANHERLRELVIDLVQARHATLAELAAAHRATPTHRGRTTVTRVLRELDDAGRTDASLELRVRERLAADGILLDRGQVPVRCRDGVTIHLDLGIAAVFFGIEVDSMRAHATRAQLRADARRSNQVARLADDWRIVRVTWDDLDRGWGEFVALVREVIAERSARHLGVPWPRPSDVGR